MLGRRHVGAALAVLALWGCNAGPNNGPAKSPGGASAPASVPLAPPLVAAPSSATGTTAPGSTAPGTGLGAPPASSGPPSSKDWMTEDEEVAWMNSLGFQVSVADLRASYSTFVPKTVDPNTNVLWDTESDDLRNYYRLYKRTNHPGFLTQAQAWRDFQVNVYSRWQTGGNNVIEPEHVYMMGLVDWYVDHRDQQTLDAINRIIDFVKTVKVEPFAETRVTARCLLVLAYYVEKIGTRSAEATAKMQDLIRGLKAAKVDSGFTVMRFAVGTGWAVENMPASIDLTQRFPQNLAAKVVTSAKSFDLKGFEGAGVYQDCILMHALHVAARVLSDPSLAGVADRLAGAWIPHVAPPFWDTTNQYGLTVPYYVVTSAPERDMFHYPTKNTPLYVTQYAAFCPNPVTRTLLSKQALLRAYNELSSVKSSELGGHPRYWLWKTWEQGYFLSQK